MKKTLLALTIVFIFSTCSTAPKNIPIQTPPIALSNTCDSLQKLLVACKSQLVRIDTIKVVVENKHLTDSLKTALFISNYKIERVRYYLNICLKNKSQDVFLKGWIDRAIN